MVLYLHQVTLPGSLTWARSSPGSLIWARSPQGPYLDYSHPKVPSSADILVHSYQLDTTSQKQEAQRVLQVASGHLEDPLVKLRLKPISRPSHRRVSLGTGHLVQWGQGAEGVSPFLPDGLDLPNPRKTLDLGFEQKREP